MKCDNNFKPLETIKIDGNKYFVDGEYWGEIIERTENYFRVRCHNGNKFMEGQILTVNFNLNFI